MFKFRFPQIRFRRRFRLWKLKRRRIWFLRERVYSFKFLGTPDGSSRFKLPQNFTTFKKVAPSSEYLSLHKLCIALPLFEFHSLYKLAILATKPRFNRVRKNGRLRSPLARAVAEVVLFKNTDLLKRTLSDFLYWKHYKQHRLILFSLRKLFRTGRAKFLSSERLGGIELVLKGRLNSAGGAKKRKRTWKQGSVTVGNRESRTYFTNLSFTTPFGSLNMKLRTN